MVFIAAPKKIETPYIKVNPKKKQQSRKPLFILKDTLLQTNPNPYPSKFLGMNAMYPPAVKHGLLVNLPIYSWFFPATTSIYQGFSNFFMDFPMFFPQFIGIFQPWMTPLGPQELLGVGMNFAAVVSGIFGALENIWEDNGRYIKSWIQGIYTPRFYIPPEKQGFLYTLN